LWLLKKCCAWAETRRQFGNSAVPKVWWWHMTELTERTWCVLYRERVCDCECVRVRVWNSDGRQRDSMLCCGNASCSRMHANKSQEMPCIPIKSLVPGRRVYG
jgi:hypothetical protein